MCQDTLDHGYSRVQNVKFLISADGSLHWRRGQADSSRLEAALRQTEGLGEEQEGSLEQDKTGNPPPKNVKCKRHSRAICIYVVEREPDQSDHVRIFFSESINLHQQ